LEFIVIGDSVSMRRLMNLIERTAFSGLPTLITGETGTGKEVTARAIHRCSQRAGPFVPINCAAIADSLIENELFGHERGSFTGADRKRQGLIERANRGTLFLDEITEMRGDAQAKLLRVIEDKRVLPVGGTEEIPIDVRFLAASNRPVDQAVAEGRLREDLYYRLNGLLIHLLPLRERLDDLPLLLDHFIDQANRAHGRAVQGVEDSCRHALRNYRWPGNIRQLHNVIETAVLLTTSTRISVEELPDEIKAAVPHDNHFTTELGLPLAEIEREYIKRTIAFVDGNKSHASKILRVPLRTLYGKLERYTLHQVNGGGTRNGSGNQNRGLL
jgi:transcriptional regulator with PAS, ATPase and Fis domain